MKHVFFSLGIALAFLLIFEAIFRATPWAPRSTFFVPGPVKGTLVSNHAHFNPFHSDRMNHQQITKKKKPGTKRVFMIGDSTMAGFYFNPEATIANWLKLSFRDLLPDLPMEVINVGVFGIASPQVLEIFKEMLDYEPDVLVVYTGQNEFLEENASVMERRLTAPLKAKLQQGLSHLTLVTWLAQKVHGKPKSKGIFDKQFFTDKMVDDPPDQKLFAEIIHLYEKNLEEMARLSAKHRVSLVLIAPFSNLNDWDPNVSYFSKPVALEDRQRFVKSMEQAKRALQHNQLQEASESLAKAAAVDSHVAELHYQQGRFFEKKGDWDQARQAYQMAMRLDGKPWRVLPEFTEMVRTVASRNHTLLYDAQKHLASQSLHGMIGKELIMDNCHPNLHGQFLMTQGILAVLAEHQLLAPADQWRWKKQKKEAEYLKELMPKPETFAKGYSRAANYLMAWLPFRYDRDLRLRKAIALYDQALHAKPDYAPALFARGLALKAQGFEKEGQLSLSKARAYDRKVDEDFLVLTNFMEALVADRRQN